MNFIDNFNDDPFVTTAFVEIPARGETAEVTVIYLGVGQAYYVDQTGKYAGTGRPTPEGFQWTADDAIAPAVFQMKTIYNGGTAAEFVQVPVTVD